MKKVLLVGNPNVGKSVIFSRLSGTNVIASNYPGTTVEFTKGYMKLAGEKAEIIDIPGTYTLEPTTKAEEVTVRMLTEGDLVINVVDATNLERNLNLTLQLLTHSRSVVVALNLWDETKHLGISIDTERLEKILGIPVVPTCAISGEGIKQLNSRLKDARTHTYTYEEAERWHEVGKIVERVQQIVHRHHTLLEKLGDLSIKPLTGIPIALGVGYLTFWVIRFIGEWLIGNVGEPIFENLWTPMMLRLSAFLGGTGFIHDILVGKLVEGEINYMESFGLLTTGLFVPFAAVLPYVFAFYLVLCLLEDSGYLPRLAVLVDTLMHRLGLHGMGIIPMLLGFGCNVTGGLATRILETKRQRFIAATLMAIAIPCMAQIAMISGLIGALVNKAEVIYGFVCVFATLFVVWLGLGLVLNRLLKGESPETLIEIPPYRIPYWGAVLKKLWMRIVWFLKEAVPFVLLGVFIINILYSLGIIQLIGTIAQPIVTGLLGLPKEAVGALIVGFLRKDVAVGMLIPLGLTSSQLVIAAVVLTMYFPCVATFAVLIKELGIRDMIKATVIMLVLTFSVGGLLNLII